MMYNTKTGKSYTIDEVSEFEFVDNEGKVIGNAPVEHNTRSLLNLAQQGLFSDYDYMPVTSKDIAQGVAAGIEANSGAYAIAKLVGTVAGSVAGNIGLGFMLSNLGVELYETARQWCLGDDPKAFWNEFTSNVQEISEDTGFMRFLDGAGIGSSYFAKGAHETLYEDWADKLEKTGSYAAGNLIGNLVKSIATISAFGGGGSELTAQQSWAKTSSALITDYTLTDSLSEMGQRIGNGTEVWEAARIGTLNGLASGAAAAFTLKAIPALARLAAPKLISAYENSGMINALANGAENVAWYKIRNDLAAVATGEEFETDPMTTAVMFGAGFGLSYLGHKFSGRGIQEEADNTFRPIAQINYREPKALLEFKDVERNNILRSLPKNGHFDNHGVVLRPEESAVIANALAARDRIAMLNDPTLREFENRIQKEYFSAKQLQFYRDSVLDIASNYKERIPVNPEGWKMGGFMQRQAIENTGDINMSKAAIDVVNDNYELMSNIGLDKQQIADLSVKAFKLAKTKSKSGNVGNFEMRQAFSEVLGGSI